MPMPKQERMPLHGLIIGCTKLMTAYTIPAFIIAIGVLITVHEYGHYIMAKWCGVKVLRFSVGFGKQLLSFKFHPHGTEFVLAMIPLGGYVKMLDEREFEEESKSTENNLPLSIYTEQELKCAFNRQAVWKRMLIVLAGPIANLLLAILLYWVLMLQGVTGLKPVVGDVVAKSPAALASIKPGEVIEKVNGQAVFIWPDIHWQLLKHVFESNEVMIEARNGLNETHLHKLNIGTLNEKDLEGDFLKKLGLEVYQPIKLPIVGEVAKESPAEKSGIRAGDQIISVDGLSVQHWEQFVDQIRKKPERKVHLRLKREQQIIDIQLTPDSVKEHDVTIGRIGVGYRVDPSILKEFVIHRDYSWREAWALAMDKTIETSTFTLSMLYKMITGKLSWHSVSGPLTIADMAGKTANVGVLSYLSFMAVISISLGVLNLLPIPVLDGGHFMYYTVELIKGSPVSVEIMEVGQRIGISLLGMLMAIALFNDINRFVTG